MVSEAEKIRDRQRRKALRLRRRSEGKCRSCEEPAVLARCHKHRIRYNLSMRIQAVAQRKRSKENGLCIRCHAVLDPDMDEGKSKCLNCREWRSLPRIISYRRRFNEDFQIKDAREL